MGFATAAVGSASMPALSFSGWPDLGFALGLAPASDTATRPYPVHRGHIYIPGHYVPTRDGVRWVEGAWIEDDFPQQTRGSSLVEPSPVRR